MSMRATGRPRGGVSLKNMDRAALKRLVGYIMRRKGMLAAVLICAGCVGEPAGDFPPPPDSWTALWRSWADRIS